MHPPRSQQQEQRKNPPLRVAVPLHAGLMVDVLQTKQLPLTMPPMQLPLHD